MQARQSSGAHAAVRVAAVGGACQGIFDNGTWVLVLMLLTMLFPYVSLRAGEGSLEYD